MRISDILVEAPSEIIYHFTSYSNAIKMLTHNTIGMSPFLAKGVESDVINTNKLFYLSTARSKLGNYGQNNHSMVAFVLDGRKLATRYSAKSVDYWGMPKSSELEDRILSNKPYIKDASAYIISVDVFFNEDMFADKLDVIKSLKDAADSVGVPLRVFDTVSKFNAGKNPMNLDKMLDNVEAWQPSYPRSRVGDFIQPYINLLKGVNLDDPATQKLMSMVINYPRDIKGALRADAHNANSTEEMKELAVLANKLKLRTLDDITAYIIQKYK